MALGDIVRAALRLGATVLLDLEAEEVPIEVMGVVVDTYTRYHIVVKIGEDAGRRITDEQFNAMLVMVHKQGTEDALGLLGKIRYSTLLLDERLSFIQEANSFVRNPPLPRKDMITIAELFEA